MRRVHLVWMSLLLPVGAWAQDRDVDLSPPTPAMFTGPGAFGDGEYTGPRTARPPARALRTVRGGAGGCPTAPDGSARAVTGSVTTGIGHSSRGGTSHYNAADLNLCTERVTASGDVGTTNLHLSVGRFDGPGAYWPGGLYGGPGVYGPGAYGRGYGWGAPFGAGVAPVRHESWTEGRRPWR